MNKMMDDARAQSLAEELVFSLNASDPWDTADYLIGAVWIIKVLGDELINHTTFDKAFMSSTMAI